MGKIFNRKVLSACLAFAVVISTCFAGAPVNAIDNSTVHVSHSEAMRNESRPMNIAREALKHVYCAERDLEMDEGFLRVQMAGRT